MTEIGLGFSGDTLILMHDGTTKKIQDIKKGDEIMSPSGNLKTITKIIQRRDKMYDIIPVKGTTYTVPKNHILILKVSTSGLISWDGKGNRYKAKWLEKFSFKSKSFNVNDFKSKQHAYEKAKTFLKRELPRRSGCDKKGDIVKISINEYMKLSNNIRRYYKGFSSGINFEENKIYINPYILGYWLGDGHSSGSGITTAEPEIVERFKKFTEKNNLLFKKIKNSDYDYRVTSGLKNGPSNRNPFMNVLRKYNLINNKHIPDDYKFNSRENRLKLLAGLIDSDGYKQRNCYDFTLKSEKLVDDIIFVARSLGFKAFKKECQKTCTNSSRGRVTGTYYRFYIYGEGFEEIPSLLERKQAHKREQKKDASVTNITIKYAGKQDYYVPKTNGSRLLLDDFTVVHK